MLLIGQIKWGFLIKIINNFVESIKVMGDQGSPVKWALPFTTVNFTGQARFGVQGLKDGNKLKKKVSQFKIFACLSGWNK
jgi:hypothetical protein